MLAPVPLDCCVCGVTVGYFVPERLPRSMRAVLSLTADTFASKTADDKGAALPVVCPSCPRET